MSKTIFKRKYKFQVSPIFSLLGILFLVIFSWFKVNLPPALSFETPSELVSQPAQVIPERIKIDILGIDLPIQAAQLIAGEWPLDENTASYPVNSGTVGRVGNPVIYAHNKASLFGSLKKIKDGDLIEIEDESGQEWSYQVEEVFTVSPKEVEILSVKDYPALTLYTCAGFLDRKRLVVSARLIP